MPSRRSLYVKCPFYKKDDTFRIVCEGFHDLTASTYTTYRLRRECQDYLDHYCCDDYESCKLFKIINDKYE